MKYTQQTWYTPAEVAIHNKSKDCWVSANGKVYNLTTWLENEFKRCHCLKTCSCVVKDWFCSDCVEYCKCGKVGFMSCDAKRQALTMLAYAGKDLTHCFKDGEWLHYNHSVLGTRVPFERHGHGFRQPVIPSTKWRPCLEPWWKGDKYVIGRMTAKARPIRITNTLTGSTVTIEVCSEETIYEIMMRYLNHNRHFMSYTFRYMGKPLCYSKTLEENGIPDERERFTSVDLPENLHIPAILIYYNDDLTEDPPRVHCVCHEDVRECMEKPSTCHFIE